MTTPAPNDDSEPDADGVSRRTLLAATAGVTGAVGTSGCVRQVRSVVNRDEIDQLSLSITTVPADGDRESIQLARDIATALETVGIDVSIDMRSKVEFLRAILINQDFDVYVGRHPGDTDPAFLYEALHSRYADEAGWQNPFGYANLAFDEFLENQRTADGTARREAVRETLEVLAVEQPFVPICVPDEYRLVRTDRFDGWENGHLATRLGYLGLEVETDDGAEPGVADGNGTADEGEGSTTLRAAHVDARPSQNLNPLAVEYRNRGTVVDLLYDSLAVEPISSQDFDSELDAFETEGADDAPDDAGADNDAPDEYSPLEPWLADSWEWDGDRMRIDLRGDCRFHDGEPLTASDVAFTYRFLADTTLGDGDVPAPSPRHRGLVSAVDRDGIDVIDDTRLEIPVETSRAAGERALLVPILPEHVWRERTAAADVPGVRVADGTTDALVTDNVPPIGSGPYQVASRAERDHVTLERFDEHFTLRPGVDRPAPTADRFRIQIDPRSTSAISLVENDDADVTSTTLESYVMDDVLERANGSGDDFPEDVSVLESRSWEFYHLGFNTRKAPFSNPRFRRVVARLLDKEWAVENVFDGHARPIAAPVIEEWTPESLAWDGEDPETPFLGADGEIDVDAARRAFEDAGFRYDAEGRLRVRH